MAIRDLSGKKPIRKFDKLKKEKGRAGKHIMSVLRGHRYVVKYGSCYRINLIPIERTHRLKDNFYSLKYFIWFCCFRQRKKCLGC